MRRQGTHHLPTNQRCSRLDSPADEASRATSSVRSGIQRLDGSSRGALCGCHAGNRSSAPADQPQVAADWDLEMTGGCHTPAGRLNTAQAAVSQVATHARTDANRTRKRVRNLFSETESSLGNRRHTIATTLFFVNLGTIATIRTSRATQTVATIATTGTIDVKVFWSEYCAQMVELTEVRL